MASVNVNRSLSDQFYRYKMPKLIAKVEGKGNGIKTVIVNMVEIAKALNRPPMYPTKYFGCVLGAQVNCDLKNERYIVNGSHESSKLQDLLDGFIQKYVLCASCSNPETVLTALPKKGIITTSCKACGYGGTLNNKDKLTTYILKYPPNQPVAASGKKEKKEKKRSKEERPKNGESGHAGQQSPQGDSDESNDFDTSNGDAKVDDDWCEDTGADAVAKRMQELSAGAKGLALNDDLDKSAEERLQIFYDFVSKKKSLLKNDATFDINTQKEIVGEAERLDVKDKAVLVLCELLFDENMMQQIKNHRMLFLRFTAGNPKAQKYLLRGFELTVKFSREKLVPRVAHILKTFYDADILDEKTIVGWGSKVNKKTVGKEVAEEIHQKAAPFLKWLQEASEEESSDSGEESGEDIEVVYDETVRAPKIEKIKEEPAKVKAPSVLPSTVADDDIDIDAI